MHKWLHQHELIHIMGDSSTHRQWMSDSWGGWSSIQTLAYKSFILVICRAQTGRGYLFSSSKTCIEGVQ
jgi:hypothetical protein